MLMLLTKIRSCFASPRLWLFLLLAFHLCVNLWWLGADNHAIRTDEETHMLMARDYYKALFPQVGDRGLGARLSAVARIRTDVGNPVHPPLLHIAGAVLARILGYSVDCMAFVNTLAFLAAISGVYLLARRFLDGGEAFFAAVVFSLTPMIYASSRYFMTDFLSMMLVIWSVYALTRSDGFHNWRWSVVFGALTGLSLLARTTGVLYLFTPAAIVFTAGFISVFKPKDSADSRLDAAGSLLANALLVLLVAVSVAAPWYVMNGRQFVGYWMRPNTGSAAPPLSMVRYETDETEAATPPESASDSVPEAKPATATPPPEAVSAPGGRWRLLLERRVPWVRYPVMIINNAVFLPMFGMFVLGAAACVFCRRFRRRALPWLLLAWVLGSYVLLTLALSFATPRYALQLLPALALLSTLPLLALPKGGLRAGAQLLYAAVLLFQYGNLTFHAYGAAAEFKLPVYADRKFQKVYNDHGLYAYKPVLHGSFSYGRMQAPMRDSFKDRLFLAMLKAEQERPFHGITANYARLNIRGMILDEEHYWLDGAVRNPFRRRDIPPELAPYRNLKSYGWGEDLDAILPALCMVDYVAYTTEGISLEKEREWQATLESHGFELVERFHEARFGMTPARWFGLMARKTVEPPPEAHPVADMEALDLEGLYQLRHSAAFRRLDPDMQAALSERMRALVGAWGAPVPLKEQVDYYHARIERQQGDFYKYTLFLYNRAPITENCRVLVQGLVSPEHMKLHFNDDSGQAHEFQMTMEPAVPTCLWPVDEVVIVPFFSGMFPIPCQVRFALYVPGEGITGNIINLGLVDFGAMTPAKE